MNGIKKLESQIAKLPKGSITKKIIQGKDRYYLQWRDGDKVKSRYLKEAELPKLSTQIAERRNLQQQLVELQVSSIQKSVENTTVKVAAEKRTAYGVAPCFGCCDEDVDNVCLCRNVTDFFLSLGKGFCFEARRKQLIVGGESFVVDFVFYNRREHCNVLVELKNEEFKQEYLNRLNACVAYYKENEMHPGDNPPVGMLLCTQKRTKMVEYATAGMDDKQFASIYKPILPTKKEMMDLLKRKGV